MIKVIVIDDQSLMRDGLEIILNSDSDLKVVACGENGKEAIELSERFIPDLVLMDLRMPIMGGVEATKIIKNNLPNVKILLLTTFEDEKDIIEAMNSGASGYIFKDIEKVKLIESIKECAKGSFIMPSKVAAVLAKHAVNKKQQAPLKEKFKVLNLTDREIEIAVMITQGFTNRQIASALYITDGTVKNYVSSIYSKTGINDRIKLALFFKEKGAI
ncbi:response regulator transcription factor [Clostridium estertheticum]|uniref:response regulator n=1 Tax=Clostridium estertheticum TaxID=238834 RepID=UPI0013E98C75|nr:response regulator transcription factor [Clostridium estertheticum]MBZ9685598.1 response regulator transcription factor [Clostridium estertheticum]